MRRSVKISCARGDFGAGYNRLAVPAPVFSVDRVPARGPRTIAERVRAVSPGLLIAAFGMALVANVGCPRYSGEIQPSEERVEAGSSSSVAAPPNMVWVPAGRFLMGTAEARINAVHARYGGDRTLYESELPQHAVDLPGFFIDKTEVTNAEYQKFIESTGREPPFVDSEWATLYNWSDDNLKDGAYPRGLANHPVVLVSFADAEAYCEWAGKALPSEEQWEKAARGVNGAVYPWGDQWDSARLNSPATWSSHELPTIKLWTEWWKTIYKGELRARVVTTKPVGSYPDGASPYGALDMAGNVFEWTRDWFEPYEGSSYENPDFGKTYKVIRGGDWYLDRIYARSSARLRSPVDHQVPTIGFRCVSSGGGEFREPKTTP